MTDKSVPNRVRVPFPLAWTLALLASTAPGCTVPFDGHAPARVAAPLAPVDSSASVARDPPERASRVLRVRAYASPSYAAQTPNWPAHLRSLFDDADPILEGAAGARLTLEAAAAWEGEPVGDLTQHIKALKERDRGDGADLVIGLVGGLPMLDATFEKAGMSETPGRYLVLRAPNVAAEMDQVDRELRKASAEERSATSKRRIRHRELAVLLHEVGHALGALHESTEGSLMRPAYDRKMTRFGPGAKGLMQATIAHEAPDASDAKVAAAARRAAAGDRLAVLRGGDAAWSPEDRAAAIAHDEAIVAPPAERSAAPRPSAEIPLPAGVREADREAWTRALALERTGDANGAFDAGKALFPAYPDVYEVQDLRCRLAMARLGTYEAARPECEPMMKLATKPR